MSNFRLQLRTSDGEPSGTTTLESFLADNEGAPAHVRELVSNLQPGAAATIPTLDLIVVRPTPRQRRLTRFKVAVSVDGLKEATIQVNRAAGTIGVRFKRRRQLYELPLSDVAALIYDRVCRANAGVGRLNGRRKRR